ncbi:MAG: sugar transferase, partial [Candidatus Woesearchaeota archaeon]
LEKIANNIFDYSNRSIAGAALLVSTPLFLICAAYWKLAHNTSCIFKQERIGQYGIPFTLYKFKSMPDDTPLILDDVDSNKELRKAYATPFGKILRKYSLDEIPNLFNVFKGEMALVGLRPTLEENKEKYRRERGLYRIKPGIICMTSIRNKLKRMTVERSNNYDKIVCENMEENPFSHSFYTFYCAIPVLVSGKNK